MAVCAIFKIIFMERWKQTLQFPFYGGTSAGNPALSRQGLLIYAERHKTVARSGCSDRGDLNCRNGPRFDSP
jgi:hypothetical protein